MNNINNLFFELIQVAIGTRNCLSHTPIHSTSSGQVLDEWGELYAMAKKQSLVGVCFAAVQKLCNSETSDYCGMNEMLYLTWMGMAAKIQQRNQIVDELCVALQRRLSAEGLSSCILKGQGVGQLYAEHLRGLRQSGDIDIYVPGGFRKVMSIAQKIAPVGKYTYVHAEWDVFEDTEVELHYRPSSQRNLMANRRFQKWVKTFDATRFETRNGIIVPPLEFNRIYLLLHCYRHVIGAGIGLRQLMDCYFCLRNKELTAEDREYNNTLLKHFGLYRFAGAVMHVLAEVYGLEGKYMICPPNKKEGEYLLKQTLIGGNFGRYDNRVKNNKDDSSIARKLFMNLRYALHYPGELLWAPIWRVYAAYWKMTNRIN